MLASFRPESGFGRSGCVQAAADRIAGVRQAGFVHGGNTWPVGKIALHHDTGLVAATAPKLIPGRQEILMSEVRFRQISRLLRCRWRTIGRRRVHPGGWRR